MIHHISYLLIPFNMSVMISAFTPDSETRSTVHAAAIVVGATIAIAVYVLSILFFGRSLMDKHGNSIPNGPWGLPIVGQLFRLY